MCSSDLACPKGTGVPVQGATLPTQGIAFTASTVQTGGITPLNMCILSGFPTAIAKNATDASLYPFGVWFANATTLYVADEGAGDNTYAAASNSYTAAAASTTAGPDSSPMRAESSGAPLAAFLAFISPRARWIARAARTARSASFSCACG